MVGDASKARTKLGWTPEVALDGLVDKMVLHDLDDAIPAMNRFTIPVLAGENRTLVKQRSHMRRIESKNAREGLFRIARPAERDQCLA